MTSSLTPSATDAFVCPLLKTGEAGRSARFERSLYQLVLNHDDGEQSLDLGFSGSRVLERLLQVPGEVVSREELLSFAWEGRVVGQGSLNQQIYTLRQALSDSRSQIIQTLPRRGYLFNPQYLQAAEDNGQAPLSPEPSEPGIVPLCANPIDPAPVIPSAPRRPRAWHSALLAGTCVMLLAGLATLGFRLANSSPPSFTHQIAAGKLNVLFVEKNQRLLDALVNETAALVENLVGMSAQPTRLIVNMSPGFYEVRCLHGDGRVNWLKIHKTQIGIVTGEYLQGCLR